MNGITIRSILFKLTEGSAPDTAQMNLNVRKMMQDALMSEGVEEILKLGEDIETEQDIFDEEYLSRINKIKLPNTKIKLIELAKAVKNLVDGQAKFPDWNKRDDIKSALKVGLILLLDEFGYPPVERDEVYVEIFEQAENFKKNQIKSNFR